MLYSMTGYGKASITEEGFTVTVEIRSLNGKALDTIVRLPRGFVGYDHDVRSIIKERLRRGRIEVYVNLEALSPDLKAPSINAELFRAYWYQLTEISYSLPSGTSPKMGDVIHIPYIFEQNALEEHIEVFIGIMKKATQIALEKLISMREEEGRILAEACSQYLRNVEELSEEIENQRTHLLATLKERIHTRVCELLEDKSIVVDEYRLIQEVAFLTERSDITEEIVRLRSHIKHFQSLMASPGPTDGRQLDFLVQEMQREATTLGAKASDLDIASKVVNLKTEIAKLREQVQNIE